MKICKVDGCNKKHDAKGYCSSHYKKYKRFGDPLYIYVKPKGFRKNKGPCVVEGCSKEGDRAGQMCYAHYMRNYRTGDPLSVKEKIEIFVGNLIKNPTNECVLWPFSVRDTGYGSFNLLNDDGSSKTITAHRYLLSRLTGIDPKDKMACHGPCHNRLCVNPHPEHGMYWGSKKENAIDQFRDGTSAAKLTDEQVYSIHSDYEEGIKVKDIAESHGALETTVCAIISGKIYKHLNLKKLQQRKPNRKK